LNELKKIKQLCVNLNVFDTINKIIEMTKYYDYLKEIDLNFEQREENIKELLNSIKKFGNENELFTIKDYLDKISLYTTASEEETKIDSVSLMTIHGAKGLEFSVVFLIGLNEGVFPKTISDNIEEERRIAYVGMTRAKHILYLTNARGYDYISHGNMSDSRFVKESHGAHIKEVFNQTITISDLQHE
jgi:DNA helicase-2/ATP-dependent DNA helicase PcrA